MHESGALFHGTKAELAVGDVAGARRESNFAAGRSYIVEPFGTTDRPQPSVRR
ncbi:hypothetical protein [Cryobacterium sp. SO1]|uniref:hypothetical protein n=1 Tax=Cryobacterium sp. SO1 TaxID=1897061 RepID=UPI00197AFA40|nr:hypothetical protein [Cryobacterium sp. SO1]